MRDTLLNLTEACEIMHISYSKAQKLAKAGSVPFRKLGSTWVISKSILYESLGLRFEPEEAQNEEIHA